LDNIPTYIFSNLSLLERYKSIFDGEKVIYIATDDEVTNESEMIYKSYFSFLENSNIKIVKNHPDNRESEYFIQQLSDLKELADEDSITFYAHTKGGTYNSNDNVLRWITSMYFFNLEQENLLTVEKFMIDDKAFSGIFRVDKIWDPWVLSNWHYSGTFFWMNNRLIFSKNWNEFEKGRFSVEAYPGYLFPSIQDSSNSELLYTEYTTSILKGYGTYDLRYDGYWDLAFNSNLLPQSKLDQFHQLVDNLKVESLDKILSTKSTAWKGHFNYAIKLVRILNPTNIVELGVDYGYSVFAFAYPKIGKVYGIDWFQGDEHAGIRDTYSIVMNMKDNVSKNFGINNIEIIKGEFNEVSKTWDKIINILHIDGLHTYQNVKNDFETWSKFLSHDGVILFHDIECFPEVRQFFDELEGYKIYRSGSCGLGIWTRNTETYEKIKLIE
jgi:hypothetical protein